MTGGESSMFNEPVYISAEKMIVNLVI